MKNKISFFILLMFFLPVIVNAEKLIYCDPSSEKYSEAGCNYIKEDAAECAKFYDFCDVYSDSWDSSKCWDYKFDGLCTAEAAAAADKEYTCSHWASSGSGVCSSKSYQGYKCKWDGNKKGGGRCYKSDKKVTTITQKEENNSSTNNSGTGVASCDSIKDSSTCQSSKVNGHECIWRQGSCHNAVDDGSNETIIADDQKDRDKKEDVVNKNFDKDFLDSIIGQVTCENIFQDAAGNYNATWNILNITLKFIQYLGIVLALVLSVLDFIKVVTLQDKDLLKKSVIKAAKRIAISIAIFFIPIILDFTLDLIGITDATCGLLK